MRAPLTFEQKQQFAEKLNQRSVRLASGCIEMQGWAVHSGHVQVSIGTPEAMLGKGIRAHRPRQPFIRYRAHVIAWELANNKQVPDGMVVCHSCDSPRCINPAHLWIGTQGDNVRDSIHKGRYNTFGRQKLNAADVRQIRERAACGESHASIARDFDIARHTVGGIVRGDSWAHVPGATPAVRRRLYPNGAR